MCSAVVDFPEPPFSLPITSRCARPAVRAAWVWAMLGLGAGWKVLVIDFSLPSFAGDVPAKRAEGS